MKANNSYYVYILSNDYNNLMYVGMTDNLRERVQEHKNKFVDGFTQTYNIDKLVYFENRDDASSAIEREKEIKNWQDNKTKSLVESNNPEWKDLYLDL